MAKFVIAGSCDCPYFAKLELLACQLSTNLPHFEVHKIVLPANEWEDWLAEKCAENNWKHEKSPIVWRELVERGGKGLLLGGFNEFMEYAQCYYGVTSDMMTSLMLNIRNENVLTNTDKIEEEKYFKSLSKPIHVCIANASNPVAYHLLPRLASGDVFGSDVELSVHLFDEEPLNAADLEGIVMEVEDLAFPLLRSIDVTTDAERAFKDASFVIFLQNPVETRREMNVNAPSRDEVLVKLAEKVHRFAQILDDVALPEAKVVVAGSGPINFFAQTLMHYSTKLNTENFIASSRMKERRARAILSRRLDVNSNNVKDVLIWGNCSNDASEESFYIGTSTAKVHAYDGAIWGPQWFSRPLVEMVHDNKWLTTDFPASHHSHNGKLTKSLRHSASLSEAASLASLLRDWTQGSSPDALTSLGVKSTGSYGVSECVISLPVRFDQGRYHVVDDVAIDEETRGMIKKTEAELKKDLRVVFPDLFPPEKQVFGEHATPPSPLSMNGIPTKTMSGLDVITEEEQTPEVAAEEKQD